jgi:hypothetical protein
VLLGWSFPLHIQPAALARAAAAAFWIDRVRRVADITGVVHDAAQDFMAQVIESLKKYLIDRR